MISMAQFLDKKRVPVICLKQQTSNVILAWKNTHTKKYDSTP